MGTSEGTDEKTLEAHAGHDRFPDASVIFSWRPQSLSAIKETCLIVLDTNVLAIPYTVSSRSLDNIGQTFRFLVDAERLIIPGQVAREFVSVRTVKLAELHKQLLDKMSRAVQLKTESYPLLAGEVGFQEALRIEGQINALISEYRAALGTVIEGIRQWSATDPVSLIYRELFQENVVLDPEFELSDIEQDLERRKVGKIPPGYKDSGKDQNQLGDLLIWHTILEVARTRQSDLIFVTNEEKADWWHRSAGSVLFPRYELVEEFRRASNGRSFHMLQFSEFLELYGVSGDVLDEVRRQESIDRVPQRHHADSVELYDGQILVVRYAPKYGPARYGAIKPIRQTVYKRIDGRHELARIDYQWWYQPDGSASFTNSAVETGIGTAQHGGESGPRPTYPEVLEIGPIRLSWWHRTDGSGWVSFGTDRLWSDDYELAPTAEQRIEDIDVEEIQFLLPGKIPGRA